MSDPDLPNAALRSLLSQAAAHKSWARTVDRSARTAPARRGLLEKFERQVDPHAELPAPERARRAEHLLRAHYSMMAYRSVRSRAKARKAREQAAQPGPIGECEAPCFRGRWCGVVRCG